MISVLGHLGRQLTCENKNSSKNKKTRGKLGKRKLFQLKCKMGPVQHTNSVHQRTQITSPDGPESRLTLLYVPNDVFFDHMMSNIIQHFRARTISRGIRDFQGFRVKHFISCVSNIFSSSVFSSDPNYTKLVIENSLRIHMKYFISRQHQQQQQQEISATAGNSINTVFLSTDTSMGRQTHYDKKK